MSRLVPEWFLSVFALATVFTVMFDLGLGIVPGEFHWLWCRRQRRGIGPGAHS